MKRFVLSIAPLVASAGALLLRNESFSVEGQEGSSVPLYLSERFDASFIPYEAYFFIQLSSGEVRRAAAAIVEASGERGRQGRFYVGARAPLGVSEEPLSYSVLGKGDEGKLSFIPPKPWSPKRRQEFLVSIDGLRMHLQVRKGLLKGLEEERRALEASLQRLRADVDIISNIGRIVQTKEELERKEVELGRTKKDEEMLKKLSQSAGGVKPPKNALQREVELTKQLGELSELARKAEASAAKAKGQSEAERKLALVELGRTGDPAPLERQLQRLKEKREQFEERLIAVGLLKPTRPAAPPPPEGPPLPE